MSSPLAISTNTTTQSTPSKGSYSYTPTAASPFVASPFRRPSTKKMSITQTYYLAHKARAKLSSEASRPDHNLRLLVGHANLLDSLMLELADAEREQESWFNQSVRGASTKEEKHIQWADTVVEEPEHDWHAEDADSSDDSDSDSDMSEEDYDEDIEMADAAVSLRRIHSNTLYSPSSPAQSHYDDFDDMEEDDEEDFAELALQRSPSHSASPPELLLDSGDSSEDETMPPSPPTTLIPTFSEKQQKQPAVTIQRQEDEDNNKDAFYDQGYYLPPRNPARLVSAISVY